MNYEELAFVNQQLAGMLKSGIPLEGSLKQLCATMRRGQLRTELEALEADLAKGTPLRDALKARQLPEFYRQMLIVGAQANDLPGVLILLADYYSKANSMWTRLKGLMVYPVIVLGMAIVVSGVLARLLGTLLQGPHSFYVDANLHWRSFSSWWLHPAFFQVQIWAPVILLVFLFCLTLAAMLMPTFRAWVRWNVPGFRESCLCQLASGIHVLLKSGVSLPMAIGIVKGIELKTAMGDVLTQWQTRLESGRGKLSDLAGESRILPPLFLWLVVSGGEEAAVGFQRAADFYATRALSRTEMLLHGALPVFMGALGVVILSQVLAFARAIQLFTVLM